MTEQQQHLASEMGDRYAEYAAAQRLTRGLTRSESKGIVMAAWTEFLHASVALGKAMMEAGDEQA